MTLIATVEYTDAAQMRADYIARRARLYRPEPRDIVALASPVEPKEPIVPGKRRLALVAYAMKAKPPVIKDAIHDWLCLATPDAMKPNRAGRIISVVSDATGVSHIDLVSERRTRNIVLPRQICFYLLKTCTPLSLPVIGRRMGGRDHTTVLHGVRKITALIETDASVRELVAVLTARLQAEAA